MCPVFAGHRRALIVYRLAVQTRAARRTIARVSIDQIRANAGSVDGRHQSVDIGAREGHPAAAEEQTRRERAQRNGDGLHAALVQTATCRRDARVDVADVERVGADANLIPSRRVAVDGVRGSGG